MTRSARRRRTAVLLIGALATSTGCAARQGAGPLSGLSRGANVSALAAASAPSEVPAVDSGGGAIALSSWTSHTVTPSPAVGASLEIDASGGQSDSVDTPGATLAALVTQANNPPTVEMLRPAANAPQSAPAIAIAEEVAVAEQPISLASALAATAGQNPQVNFARQRIAEAFAHLEAAEVLWLPSIRAGGNYNKHEGRIQDVAGRIIETSRGSVYGGLGAQAVGAGSPAVPGVVVDFHLRDAVFLPRIASQTLGARRQESRTVTNDLMLETALAYVDLLEALQLRAVAEQMLQEAQTLADTTQAFAQSGQGLQADADRSRTEVSFRQMEVRRGDEAIRLASVRLAQLLRTDQSVTLVPIEPVLIPIDMVDADVPLPQLISAGLVNRPELAEARFLVGEAVQRYQRERYAPLVPSVLLGLSYGGNGGGLGSDIDRFGDRMDVDVAAFWEIRNLGWGEQAARNAASSRLEQARWRQLQQMDQVAADVAQAQAEVIARRDQLSIAQEAIAAAEDSYRRNRERIRDAQGLPIEVLQSMQSLDAARRRYTQLVADYNRSQFRLQRALGWPVELLEMPAPCP